MVPIKLMRILANEHPNNVLAALRCIKKLCYTCGENGYDLKIQMYFKR